MKVKFLTDRYGKKGTTAVVDNDHARMMISRGIAEEANPKPKPKKGALTEKAQSAMHERAEKRKKKGGTS